MVKVEPLIKPQQTQSATSIDWYAEGESRSVYVNGLEIVVRHIGRKGRRSRIAIVAPAGAVFRGDSKPPRAN